MNITTDHWTASGVGGRGYQLVQLPLPVMDALANGHLQTAQDLFPQHHLTPYLISNECDFVWRRRAAQIKADETDAIWVTRIVVNTRGEVVGRAGFHEQPDQDGTVEVGYSIDPLCRRQGHARAALRILLDVAAGDSRVKAVRASVRPDNHASRGLMVEFGLQKVGEQIDEIDGLEEIFEKKKNGDFHAE